jgi:hypothetical protein
VDPAAAGGLRQPPTSTDRECPRHDKGPRG